MSLLTDNISIKEYNKISKYKDLEIKNSKICAPIKLPLCQ